MRKLTLIVTLFFMSLSFAQSNSINYKALIKDANNAVVANTMVTVQFSILQGVAQTNVYQETHTPTTDANGIIIINIGEGTVDSGVFADIDWASDDHFLNTQINTGAGLVDMGTTGFKTVPYALSAKTAANVTGLETIDEGNGNGLVKVGRNESNYGNVGLDAVDLSYSNGSGTDHGALGDYSFAAGRNTVASGEYSTVSGLNSEATGSYSTAIGRQNLATEIGSTALGYLTEATGIYSTSLGQNTEASGSYTTAMGSNTRALGIFSSTMGLGTLSESYGNTAIGIYNVGGGTLSTRIETDPLFEIGNGIDDANRNNALTVLKNGTITAPSFDLAEITDDKALITKEYADTNYLGAGTAPSGLETIDEGNGNGLVKIGRVAANYGNVGLNAVDLSYSTLASTTGGATGSYSIAMGNSTTASEIYSTAMGLGTTASGNISTAMGIGTTASGNVSTAMGSSSTASGDASMAMGSSSTASGVVSTAMGSNTTASGSYSTAMGRFTMASEDNSTAMGFSTTASGIASVAMGDNSEASGVNSFAMGDQALASGLSATAMGREVTASGNYSIAKGFGNTASGTSSTAIGQSTTATGNSTTSMGFNTTAQAYSSLAVGRYNVGGGDLSSWVDTDAIFEIGNGSSSSSLSNALTVLKNGTITAPSFDISEITDDKALITKEYAEANLGSSGLETIDEGNGNGLVKVGRVAANYGNVGLNAVDLSFSDFASTSAGATGSYSTAMGHGTIASGFISLAMGFDTTASGNFSTAMGLRTTASEFSSTAMGSDSEASGSHSTAMGRATTASGLFSTAMGSGAEASGAYSTAMGNLTHAQGERSTAMGVLTTAESYGQTTLGIYNVPATPLSATTFNALDPLFEIGNGTSNAVRSNALTILKNGTITAPSFDISEITDDKALITKEYFDANGSASTGLEAIDEGNGNGLVKVGRVAANYGNVGLNAVDLSFSNATSTTRGATVPYATAFGINTTASGNFSTAIGGQTVASGNSAVAMGNFTTASGLVSTAFGASTLASGIASTAMGEQTIASGDWSTATGEQTVASGNSAVAMGNFTTASGLVSTTFGASTLASGTASTAMGEQTIASGGWSTAMGLLTTAESYGQTTLGVYNVPTTPLSATTFNALDPLFEIGNGTSDANRSNALTVLKNGTITAPSFDMVEITDDKALITKEYADANYSSTPTITTNTLSYSTGFSDFGSSALSDPTYYIHGGRVYLEGLVGVSISGTGNVVATLPVGFRPDSGLVFNQRSTMGVDTVRIDVRSNGEIVFISESGSSTWFSLSGISFRQVN